MWTDLPVLLAQDAPPPAADAPPPAIGDAPADTGATTGQNGQPLDDPNAAPEAPNPFGAGFFMLLAVMLIFIFLMGGGRREKKKRAAMLAALGKGDRVQTIGGIRGTVLEIKDDEVTLKVDENSNARMRFASSAIQSVLESKNGDEAKS